MAINRSYSQSRDEAMTNDNHDDDEMEVIELNTPQELQEVLIHGMENCEEELETILDVALEMETFKGLGAMAQAMICIVSQAAPNEKSAVSTLAFYAAYMLSRLSKASEAGVCRWNQEDKEKLN